MPRRPRLEIPGMAHHVVQRGVDRQAVFFDPGCCLVYLQALREQAGKCGVRIHAWCLMTNHIHLLATPDEPGGLARLMHALNRSYVHWVNARYRRMGPLWSGRYKSGLIGDDAHLLTCMRYIELNPVRARMVDHPDAYPWSSWHANTGRRHSTLITPHPVFCALGAGPEERHRRYAEWVLESQDPSDDERLRTATRQNAAFGSERFIRQIERMTGRRVTPRKSGRPRGRG
ncbi:transposase [Ectothiorhodospira mobilis]|uniref:transposase n=1 Tax=Ectothiorhodospira mobilis TaxID=195064 RepID=UPI001903E6A9|nr:transposase [Ectothiorhodospira mobilis]MBK1692774.1 hypothetical protein [Ectothiorhodospira mobilis]